MERYLSREKLLGVRHHRHFPLAAVIIGILLLLDLLFLNYKILSMNKSLNVVKNTQVSNEKTAVASSSSECGAPCMSEINKAVSVALSTEKNVTINTQPSSSSGTASSQGVQEYFIPLGSGVISSGPMATVPGMQATIDGNAYGTNYTATFEISVSVPTGNQTANFQLYNSTANHPVWNSSVNFTGGGTPQLLISSPITLDPGNNTYIVQGSTQLQFPAYITQARVHIITQ